MTTPLQAAGAALIAKSGRDLPTYTAYAAVVGRTRARIDQLFPQRIAGVNYDSSDYPPPTRTERRLGAAWRDGVSPLLDRVDPLLAVLAGALLAPADRTRTREFQLAAKNTAVTAASAEVTYLGAQIKSAADDLLAQAQKLALPTRPEPQDVAQEARLAGIKSDLQLLTSTVTTRGDFLDRLADRLRVAAADQDELATWLLCSDWPLGILAPSVGFTDADTDQAWLRGMWNQQIVDILAPASADMANAIAIYQALDDPSNGLAAIVVATGGFLRSVLNDIADYAANVQPLA